ncbi:MAG TPA: 30S ribosomal protein S4 [Phycisphaerae bacterium]|jgi:small subunit ribosomal protein S4|nr:30S ribosomal protein S4 [Phycisphaerae bacterium]HOB75767.1 30S ribosomal protein S4 [Phycisphaerae bacterium]HOJ55601.1 30S ribosomal protein S4 [Phycisphaerae bacterium]HOL27703.1 30S ribosomal protein S4 [Phycisphaerae bacterium]HPP21915.1 30S ribosomal protein S4 [Phycisphaerae bacterium]
MSRYIGPVCRQCRREGIKLMLKGIRCETAKCPMEKQWRSNPPGMHAWRRGKGSGYALRLREKQKVKRFYGVLEKQFMLLFRQAERSKENTGTAMLQLLERRLDNVVCKAGFAPSRKSARVMITQGHIYVNGRRVDRPSFMINVGDKISVKPSDKSRALAKRHLELIGDRPPQPWIQRDSERLEAVVVTLPSRDDVQIPVEEQLIVEMCSR